MRTAEMKSARLSAVGIVLLVSALCNGQPKPKGPEAVANQEPNRVIAIIDGKPLTAKQAMNMLKLVSPPVRRAREAQLPKLVQHIYMQRAIAQEAIRLHLDTKSPWREKLAQTHRIITQGAVGSRVQAEKDTDPAVVAQWHSARDKILWNAYFAQAATKEERDALLQKEKEKYKLQVRDPDFFNGVTS